MTTVDPNWIDRFALAISPRWGAARLRERAIAATMARHYEAAAMGRRGSNWARTGADANVASSAALRPLRALSHDLLRNNGWARSARRNVVSDTVGWGITTKADGKFGEAWRTWTERECDADGRLNFAGIQALAMGTVFESGEALIRRRWRRASDGFTLPLQLQVLEPDFLDTLKDGMLGLKGGPIIQGIEFDQLGRRDAYWLFDQHPGSNVMLGRGLASNRVPAAEIIHVCPVERPGQVRGAPWLSAAIVNLKDFDEFEDADLLRAKIAACFVAFTTDVDGGGAELGERSTTNPLVETFEPGMIVDAPPGRDVKFGVPPITQDNGFSTRTLRRIAASIGVTYEAMTGDFSQVNFSSARMGRINHWASVNDWRWNMLVPQLCDGVWAWAQEAAGILGLSEKSQVADWTAPPMPMLEPDREGLALQRNVRAGLMTVDEMVREQGKDPKTHWAEYAASFKRLREAGIVLDSDAAATTQSGQAQSSAGGGMPVP